MHPLQCRVEPISCCIDARSGQLFIAVVSDSTRRKKMRPRSAGGRELFTGVAAQFKPYCPLCYEATANSVIDQELLMAIQIANVVTAKASVVNAGVFPHYLLRRFPSILAKRVFLFTLEQIRSLTNPRQRYDVNHAIVDGYL
jgi:hypothetical protein